MDNFLLSLLHESKRARAALSLSKRAGERLRLLFFLIGILALFCSGIWIRFYFSIILSLFISVLLH